MKKIHIGVIAKAKTSMHTIRMIQHKRCLSILLLLCLGGLTGCSPREGRRSVHVATSIIGKLFFSPRPKPKKKTCDTYSSPYSPYGKGKDHAQDNPYRNPDYNSKE